MDKMRQEFDKWIDEYATGADLYEPITLGMRQINMIKLIVWKAAWVKSRESLCVNLPRQWFDDDHDCDLMEAHNVSKSLDEAGIKYK